ncbi:hypothetical protein PTKIN_Ptkin12aG0119000 [Pterospermum kingtungense]
MITVTGISTILAAMLFTDDGTDHPLFTTREAVDFITQNNSKLFKVNKLFEVLHCRNRFSGKSMDKVLKQMFKRDDRMVLTLKDTCKPLPVPYFDLKSAAPFVFSRTDAFESPSLNFKLWKVCHTTSATPSLFKPFPLTSINDKTMCSAVDGCLVMNNPTTVAITHVLHNKRDFPSINGVKDLLVLSLGNGLSCGRSKVRNNIECSTSSVVDIVLDGVSEMVDQMLGNAFYWNRIDYIRIQANRVKSERMVRPRIEEVLKKRGVKSLPFCEKRLLMETNRQRIEGFVQRLVAS